MSDKYVNAARAVSTGGGDVLLRWVDWYCDLYDLAAYKHTSTGLDPA